MALTINTNIGSLVVEKDLNQVTKSLHKALEIKSENNKVNYINNDSSDYAVQTKTNTKLNSISVAQDNVSIGTNLLSTTENNYKLIENQLKHMKDLTEQAANGNVDTKSMDDIKAEVETCLIEIDKIAESSDFNGIKLIDGNGAPSKNGITLQIGVTNNQSSRLILEKSLFEDAHAQKLLDYSDKESFISCFDQNNNFNNTLAKIDNALNNLADRKAKFIEKQQILDAAADSLEVQYANVTSSLSTIKDTDVASASPDNIKDQILQQASASLLSTANQSPSIALNLI